jgi:hypothetical protein
MYHRGLTYYIDGAHTPRSITVGLPVIMFQNLAVIFFQACAEWFNGAVRQEVEQLK